MNNFNLTFVIRARQANLLEMKDLQNKTVISHFGVNSICMPLIILKTIVVNFYTRLSITKSHMVPIEQRKIQYKYS